MSADKYDFIITHNSTDYKYMLRQQGNTKDFLVSDAPLTPQTLVTESASPTTLQPERQIQISQVDWRKGFQDFKLDDEYKYYDSENCDARFKGEVTLSPKKLSAISFGTTPTVSLADVELDIWTDNNNLTYWSETLPGAPEDWFRRDTYYRHTASGYSVKFGHVTSHTGGNYDSYISQSVYTSGNLPASLRNAVVRFSVWAFGSDAGEGCKIAVYDGINTTTSDDIITQTTTWQQGSVTHKLDSNADELTVKIYFATDANEDYVWVDDVTVDAYPVYGSITDEVEFGNNIVVASGNSLFTIESGSAILVHNLFHTITDLCVFKDRLYIAQGWGYDYLYTSDLVNFTTYTDSAVHPKYFANIGGDVMICSDTNSTLRSSDNPINGGTAWSSAYQVGSDDWDITGLVDHEDTWFVRKEDNVYYLSGSDVLPLIPEISSEASTTYTYGLYYWKGNLYIGSGVNSLYEYDISSGTVTTISPTRYAPGDSNYDGQVLAICGDETYLYVAIDNGSDIKILSGRWENVEGDTDWYWHPLYTLSSHNNITTMLISSLSGNKRLYTGTNNYTDGIIPYIVSVGYSQPYTESGYECQSSGTFITPWYVSNFPTETKYWKSVDFTSICCTDKTSITPYYQIKGGSWVEMDALTTSTYDGGYPAETTDSRAIEQESERIRFKFEMAASNDDYTPILYGKGGGGIVTYAVLQATKKRQITATLQISPKIRLRDGTVEERTVSTDLSNLRTIYQAGGEITVTAPDETTYTCVFARDGYSEQLGYDEVLRTECWWCRLQLLEV